MLPEEQLEKLRAFRKTLRIAAIGLALEERLGHTPEDGWHDVTPEDNFRAKEILGESGGQFE
jgi:hypothetical protein